MSVDRIDSYWNTQAISQEKEVVVGYLSEAQQALVSLYNMTKQYKDTSLVNLAENTEKLNTAINGSVQLTNRAKEAFDGLTNRISAQVKMAGEAAGAVRDNSQAYDQLIKQAVRNKIVLDDLAASQAALKKGFQAGVMTMQEYESSLTDIRTAQQQVKTSNADVTKTLNNLERGAQSASGSLNEMRSHLNALVQSYDKLSQSERESAGGQGLQKTIQTVTQAVTALEVATGRSQRKVGDYTGALKILESALAEANGRLERMASAGQQDSAAFAKVSEEVGLLNVLIGQQSQGFSSVTMQIRATERALQTLRAEGFGASEAFQQLRESTIQANQQQKEFQRQQKLLESEAPVLGAVTLAAKGLAGAYAIGAGSVALFADGNERVEKELNKLVAIMTILQGLHEAYELIQQAGAIALAIRMATTRAANAVLAKNTALTEGNAVANTELAASEGLASAGAEAETVAMGELAVGAEAAAAAVGEAEVATTSFGVAFLATGIGAAIAGVAIAVVYLLSKIPDWIQGNQLTIKQQEELADAAKSVTQALIDQVETINDLDKSTQRYYQNLLSNSEARGESEEKRFAITKKLAESERDAAQAQIDALGATNAQQSSLAAKIQDNENKKKEASDIVVKLLAIPKQNRTSDQNRELDAAKDNVEYYNKLLEGPKALYAAGKKAREDLYAANKTIDENDLKQQKFTEDERRKIILESITLESDLRKSRNDRTLNDERSSLNQQLSAIEDNAKAERRIILANRDAILNDPGSSTGDKLIAQRKAGEELVKLNEETGEKIRVKKEQFRQRDLSADLSAFKTAQDQRIKADQDIEKGNIDNPNPLVGSRKASLQERLKAAADEFSARRDMLEAERSQELNKQGLVDKEKEAIEAKFNADMIQLSKDLRKSQAELEQEAQQQSLQQWDQYYAKRKAQIDKDEAAEIVSLNNRRISDRKYAEERQKIEDEAAVIRLSTEAQNAYLQVNSSKEGTKARADAEGQLAQKTKELSDAVHKQKKDEKDSEKADTEDLLQNIDQQSKNYASAITDVLDISYNTQKVHLEELEVRQQRAYEQQVTNINDSTATEEQKAIRLKILDDQRAVQKEQNDRKQRQLDIQKAQFDKAKDVLGIITGTALAVVKALPNIPLAISVGILGAAELAAAIATPLPHYAEGTEDHPGGGAVVGDAYQKELIVEPGKAARWSNPYPTLENLAKHTKVYPAEKIQEAMMSGMYVTPRGVLIEGSVDNRKELREMKETMIWQTQRLENAMKNNRPRVINRVEVRADWHTYVHNNVFK